MNSRVRWIAVTALLLTIAPIVSAQAEPPAAESHMSKSNVLVTVRIGKVENGKRETIKSYDLVVADGTNGSKLLSGQRVPFPTGVGESSGDEPGFVYRNIGFVTEVRAWIVGDKLIKLMAQIEDSRLTAGQAGLPPIVETRQLDVNAMLTDGVAMDLTRAQGITDQSGFVEVEAKILRQK